MRKLSLELDALEVESFETAAALSLRGTAHAHNAALVAADTQADPCLTCELTCQRGCEGDDPAVIQGWPAEPPPTGFGATCNWERTCLQ